MLAVEPDGLQFDITSLRGETIKEDADYAGVRVTLLAYLQNAKVHMQLDMGFGDALAIPAAVTQYPTILDLAPPQLLGYSREVAVAEKFEAMVKLGRVNSRTKDFFDIWLLSHQFSFDGVSLAAAIAKTFSHRTTDLVVQPFALTPTFASDPAKISQWRGFLRKSRITMAPDNLTEIINDLSVFLLPVARALAERQNFCGRWNASGPWEILDS